MGSFDTGPSTPEFFYLPGDSTNLQCMVRLMNHIVKEPLKRLLGFKDMPKGDPLEEILGQASLWDSQPAELNQLVAHILDKFYLYIQEVVLQEVTDMGVYSGRTQGMQIQKGLIQALFQKQGGFHGVQCFTHSSWDGFCTFWKRVRLLC